MEEIDEKNIDLSIVKIEDTLENNPLSEDNVIPSTSKSKGENLPKSYWQMRFTCTFCNRKCVNRSQLRGHRKKYHPNLVAKCELLTKPCFILLNNVCNKPSKPSEWVHINKEYIQKLDFNVRYCVTSKNLCVRNEEGYSSTATTTSNGVYDPIGYNPPASTSEVKIEIDIKTEDSTTPMETEDDMMEISENKLFVKSEDDNIKEPPIIARKQAPAIEKPIEPPPTATEPTSSKAAESNDTTEKDASKKNSFLKPHEISAIVSACFRKLSNSEKLLIYNEVYHPGKSFNTQFLSLIQTESIKVLWTPNNKVSKPPMLCKRLKIPKSVNFMEGLQPYEAKKDYLNGAIPLSQSLLNINKQIPKRKGAKNLNPQLPADSPVIEVPITQITQSATATTLSKESTASASRAGNNFVPSDDSNLIFVGLADNAPVTPYTKAKKKNEPELTKLLSTTINDIACTPKIVSAFSLPRVPDNEPGSSSEATTSKPLIKCKPTELLMATPSSSKSDPPYLIPLEKSFPNPIEGFTDQNPMNDLHLMAMSQPNMDNMIGMMPQMNIPNFPVNVQSVIGPTGHVELRQMNDIESEITTHKICTNEPKEIIMPNMDETMATIIPSNTLRTGNIAGIPNIITGNIRDFPMNVFPSTSNAAFNPLQYNTLIGLVPNQVSSPVDDPNTPKPFSRLKESLGSQNVELLLMHEFLAELKSSNNRGEDESNLQTLVKFKVMLTKFYERQRDEPFFVVLFLNKRGSFVMNINKVYGTDPTNVMDWPHKYQTQLLKILQQKVVLNTISVMASTSPNNVQRKTNIFLKTIAEFL